jgi:hypothetical protein
MLPEVLEALETTRDRYTSVAMICSTCRGLLIRPDETIENNTPASYDFRTIVNSAAGGCPICEISRAKPRHDETPNALQTTVSVNFEPDVSSNKFLVRSLSVKTDRDNGPWRFSILLEKVISYGFIRQIREQNANYYPPLPDRGPTCSDPNLDGVYR